MRPKLGPLRLETGANQSAVETLPQRSQAFETFVSREANPDNARPPPTERSHLNRPQRQPTAVPQFGQRARDVLHARLFHFAEESQRQVHRLSLDPAQRIGWERGLSSQVVSNQPDVIQRRRFQHRFDEQAHPHLLSVVPSSYLQSQSATSMNVRFSRLTMPAKSRAT